MVTFGQGDRCNICCSALGLEPALLCCATARSHRAVSNSPTSIIRPPRALNAHSSSGRCSVGQMLGLQPRYYERESERHNTSNQCSRCRY